MKLVHWLLMGVHLVQRGWTWAGPQPTQTHPRRPCSDFMDMLRRLISCRIMLEITLSPRSLANVPNITCFRFCMRCILL